MKNLFFFYSANTFIKALNRQTKNDLQTFIITVVTHTIHYYTSFFLNVEFKSDYKLFRQNYKALYFSNILKNGGKNGHDRFFLNIKTTSKIVQIWFCCTYFTKCI